MASEQQATNRIAFAGLSDTGRVRERNEDRWLAVAERELSLFIVADGMGGEMAGELASEIVVETLPGMLRHRLAEFADLVSAPAASALRESLADLSRRMRNESRGQPGLDGMGSTVVAALVGDRHALIGHMGDSRAYLLRDGILRPLTKDHSIVQLLIDYGEIRPDEAAEHPARGQLSRYVGMDGESLPQVAAWEIFPGDRLLLASDGLTGMVRDDELSMILRRHEHPEAACRRLIEAANAAGGWDNITAVVIAIESV